MRTRSLVLAFAALAASLPGRADTIITYNIAAKVALAPVGSTTSTLGGSVNGTLAIDYTNLKATVANLTFESNAPTATVFNPYSSDYYGPETALWTGTPSSVASSSGSRPSLEPYFGFRNGEGDSLSLGVFTQAGSPYLCTLSSLCGIDLDPSVSSFVAVLQTLPPLPGYTTPPPNTQTIYITETFTSGTATIATTPEPSSFALLGSGILGVAGLLRRRTA